MIYQAFNKDSENCPVEWEYGEDYEIVVDMESNEVVCVLTEPEDRTFTRDLSGLLTHLNAEAAKSDNVFPTAKTVGAISLVEGGLSKRELIAALLGIGNIIDGKAGAIGERSVRQADALLAELER